MRRSILLRAGTLATSSTVAPLALAQEALASAATTPPWSFIAFITGLGILFVLGIIAIVFLSENHRQRQRLALIERFVTNGQPVPRELMVPEPRRLTLPEMRRGDIRRGIAFLCWGIGVGLVLYIVYGGNPRAAAWSLLFIVPGLGNFVKAWLAAREIERAPTDGSD